MEAQEGCRRRRRGGVTALKGADGKLHYYGRFVDLDGKRKNRALEATTEKLALQELAGIKERVRKGMPGVVELVVGTETPPATPAMTLRGLCEKFRDEYQGEGLADVKHYRRQAWSVLKCHVLPTLGDRDVPTIRRVDISNLRDVLKSLGRSSFIISRTLRQLGKVFNWALEK